MIFKVHSKYESQDFHKSLDDNPLIKYQISYVFKDYRGLSEWRELYIWSEAFQYNQFNYFYWSGEIID